MSYDFPDPLAMNGGLVMSTMGPVEGCARRVLQGLEAAGREVICFDTVGLGGQALEETVQESADVAAVVYLSLQELLEKAAGRADQAGLPLGQAALGRGLPTVLVPGCADFLVCPNPIRAAAKFPGRPVYVRNPAQTLVRSSREELMALGRALADLCNPAVGPVSILLPLGGFSALDHPVGPWPDREAPHVLAEVLRCELDQSRILRPLPLHINDPDFARAVLAELKSLEGSLEAFYPGAQGNWKTRGV
jgi:uncharacterized protein (UPF0261 family)